jgi:NTE family protein
MDQVEETHEPIELNVCLLGGGTRMAAYMGALKAIEEQGGRVVGWAGASAGSLLAAFLASGFSHQQTLDLVMHTDYRQFLDFRLLGVLRDYGIYSGRNLEAWLESRLEGRHFRDLQTPLSVICTDVESSRSRIFSKDLTPDAKLSATVRASVGIPGIFAVRRINGSILVDGALLPVDDKELFPQRRPAVTIRLVRTQAAQSPRRRGFGFAAYIERMASILLDAVDDVRVSPDRWRHTLLIHTGHYSSVNFELSAQDKQALYQMGYEQCHKYVRLRKLLEATNNVDPAEPRDPAALEQP